MTDTVAMTLICAALPGVVLTAAWLVRSNDNPVEDGVMMGIMGYAFLLVMAALVSVLLMAAGAR